MKNIISYLQQHSGEILSDIKTLVAAESPSMNKAAVDRCGDVLRALFAERLGIDAEIDVQEHYGNHLKFTLGSGSDQTVVLGHFDTVWDEGELPMREEAGKFYGPGILDMKAGLVQSIWAARALKEHDLLAGKRIVFLCGSDEEVGSPSSSDWLSQHALGSSQVLVVEPAVAGSGALKVARKGTGQYQIAITGQAAHAGNNPEEGISAVQEMAHQVLFLHGLNAPDRGTTVNVGIAQGGNRINVVADKAVLGIDTRVTSEEEAQRIHDEITQIQPHLPGIKLEISGAQSRPPMRQSAESRVIMQRAQAVAQQIGFSVGGQSVGGGSDGNFTAALGIPTLDGLGATGAGIHARHEHIIIADIASRTALVAGLMLGDAHVPG
ncbi:MULTISPECIES: M20 family metallopeptidase [unclassified Pantoea]|uniref:M20 family metallopeptidase n=1 Tax=unclassified Pantoea TaxID=2630326 RepID=UPI001CD30471|nr:MULTISPECIES: M20 family metallopeptidase [unclassified Pantoea]MCA1177531.1 M20 family metallopeptidase [Pantoea sp. alder69]MCA1249563.1 M20 family metallopeptidase [Pantoea sp. alder70]MCA1266020.1 M20 family metallopeptidase [Pantoea sp. alder81]